jgi:uncharacterized protein involved in outer membrane biogenesis
MKLVFSLISVFLVLVVGGVLIAPQMIDWNQHKGKVLEQIKTHAGYDVEIDGDISFAIVPSPHVSLKKIRVQAPEPVTQETLASIEEASVYVALTPLFKKQIRVKGVKIINPDIVLEVSATGKKSWESAKLKAVKDVSDTVSGGSAPEKKKKTSGNDFLQNIAVDNVTVKGGKFIYRDQQKKSETIIRDLNASVAAESLYGPYEGDVSFELNGKAFDVSATAQEFDPDARVLPLKFSVVLDDAVETQISGVLDMSKGVAIQGPLTAEIKDLQGLTGNKNLPKALSVKGMLKADNTAIELSQLEGTLGKDSINGRVSVKLNPLVASIDLAAVNGLDLAPVLPKLKQAALKSLVATKDGTVLFQDTVLELNDQSVALKGSFQGGNDGARAALAVNVSAQDLNLDDILRVVSKPKSSGAASSETAEASDNVASANSKASLKKTIQNISLPIDLSVKADVKKLIYQGASISGLKTDITARANAITVNSFSVSNYGGAAMSAKGRIGNLAEASGIAGSAAFETADVRAFMGALKMDAQSLPKPVKAIDLVATFEGGADALKFTTNIDVAGAKIIAKGDALNALETPKFSNLALQVKHSNLNTLLGGFAPGLSYASLAKPLDFYAVIDSDGKVHSLKNMKIDLAGTPVTGNMAFDLSGATPNINGALNAGDIMIVADKVQAQAAARTAKGKAVQSSSGSSKSAPKWSSKAIDFGWMHAFSMDLSVAAQSLVFETWAFQKPSLGIKLSDGRLNISDLKAGLYGGQAAVNASVSAPKEKGASADIALDAALTNVQIEDLMTSLAAGQKLIQGKGAVSLKTDVKTSGSSQNDFVNRLSGQGTTTGSNIVLDGFDLSRFARAMDVSAKPGDTLVGLWKGSTKGGSTAFDTLDGAFTIEKGIVKIAKMDLDGTKALMATTGTVDVPKWWVSTKHEVSVKDTEAVPPFEFSFDGSLADPKQTFAQGPLQDYLSRKISRKLEKELSDKLGSKLKDKLGDGELGNLLGGFLGAGQTPKQQVPQQQQAPANDNTQPVNQQQDEQAPADQPPQQLQPEEILQDVLKGLF